MSSERAGSRGATLSVGAYRFDGGMCNVCIRDNGNRKGLSLLPFSRGLSAIL